MQKLDLQSIPLDDLWLLHEQITEVLSARIIAQKQELDERLQQLKLGRGTDVPEVKSTPTAPKEVRERRKYPPIHPKYRNPREPGETWSGRGKTTAMAGDSPEGRGADRGFCYPKAGLRNRHREERGSLTKPAEPRQVFAPAIRSQDWSSGTCRRFIRSLKQRGGRQIRIRRGGETGSLQSNLDNVATCIVRS